MQSMTGDTPQMKGSTCLKSYNRKTECPFSLCKARQSNKEGEVGGEIGRRDFDIVKHRRTRGRVEDGRHQLMELGRGTKEAVELSEALGVVQPDDLNQPRALFDLVTLHSPMVACGPELLHLDSLVR
ncbi:unnamed protein product [Ectocarpus sp. CCAP 1310/34]|nr:unnamed protein product [Ectocarpus sp. CCAP 1310/34]